MRAPHITLPNIPYKGSFISSEKLNLFRNSFLLAMYRLCDYLNDENQAISEDLNYFLDTNSTYTPTNQCHTMPTGYNLNNVDYAIVDIPTMTRNLRLIEEQANLIIRSL